MRVRLALITAFTLVGASCGNATPASETLAPHPTASIEVSATARPVTLSGGTQRLAFISDRDGPFRLYTMAPDGSDIRQLSTTDVDSGPYSISRDGTQVAAAGAYDDGAIAPHMYRVDVLGGAAFDLGQAPPSDSELISPAFQWQADDAAIPVFNSLICYAFPSGGGEIIERDLTQCVENAAQAERPGGGYSMIFGSGLFIASESDVANPDKIDTVLPAAAAGDSLTGLAYLALQSFGLWRPLFSPDGTQIAYLDGDAGDGRSGLAVIAPDGSNGRLVVEAGENEFLLPGAWSADGRELFVSGMDAGSSIHVVDVATGTSRLLLGEDGHSYMYPRWVVESPAPARSAAAPAKPSRSDDLKMDLKQAPGRLVYNGGQNGFRGQFTSRPDGSDERMIAARVPYGERSSDDGRWIVYGPGTILDTATGTTRTFSGGDAPSVSPDGRRVAYWIQTRGVSAAEAPTAILTVADLETAASLAIYRGLGLGYAGNVEAAWSPDGRRLAFFQTLPSEREKATYRWDLSVVDADGGPIVVLGSMTSNLSASGPLTWSPDGTRVAFDDDILRVADVNSRKIRDYDVYADAVSWSPDGSQIAVRGGGLLLVDAKSGDTKRLTADIGGAVEYPPVWSPDGRWLAYTGSDATLRVLEVSSGTIMRLNNEVDRVVWAAE